MLTNLKESGIMSIRYQGETMNKKKKERTGGFIPPESNILISSKSTKARKKHNCDYCFRVIEKGEIYMFEGYFSPVAYSKYQVRYCKDCMDVEEFEYNPKKPNFNHRKKKIEVLDIEGEVVGIYDSLHDLERRSWDDLGVHMYASWICGTLKDRSAHHKGYFFRYVSEDEKELSLKEVEE